MKSTLTTRIEGVIPGFAQDFDMQIQAAFKDYSRTNMKIFKEL